MAIRSDDPLLERLAALETGQVSDVLDEAGLPNHAASSALVPLAPGAKLAGRAACARGRPIVQAHHVPPVLPADALERLVAPGSIVVIECGGFTAGAVLGGFVAYSLQRAGCRGIITDGAVRDADEIRDFGLPLFASAVTPLNGSRRWRLTETDIEIHLPGQTGVPVRVQPGDLILADGDGIVVVPAPHGEQIIEDAEELARIEKNIGEGLRSGQERADVFRGNPRFSHVRAVSDPAAAK